MNINELCTVHEAAELMGVHRTRIYQLMKESRLKPAVEYDSPKFKLFRKSHIEKLRDELVPRRPRGGGRKVEAETEAAQ
jgi:DNA-directed RNA polymerase subunit F